MHIESVDTPDVVDAAVLKIEEHFGPDATKVYYSADGEAIVQYRTPENGLGIVRVIPDNKPGWVACLYVKPQFLLPGLPDKFNTTFMFDVTRRWWPAKP